MGDYIMVRPGQVWADNDPRYKDNGERQNLIVDRVYDDEAVLINPSKVPRWRESHVRTDEINRRFTLVSDVTTWPETMSRQDILQTELAQLGIASAEPYEEYSIDFERLLKYIDNICAEA